MSTNPAGWLPSWRTGPLALRDTRDTLFMLAVILWTVAPHLLRISPWIALLCLLVLGWRARLAWQQGALPGRWSLLAVLLLAGGLTWASERTLVGKDAGVTLLVVLMALKTLELRARRDALVVFFLGFFLVLTQFFYSQSLLTALGVVVSVWGWLTALTLAHMPAGHPRLREVALLAGRAAVVGTPVMVALFLLFPRIGPLWSLPGDTARTGLSNELGLGDVASLAQDDSIALRVRYDGPVPAPNERYFRGPVLIWEDGNRWLAQPPLGMRSVAVNPLLAPDPAVPSRSIRYEMTLEPLRVKWLPLLEYTASVPVSVPSLEGLEPPNDDSLQWRLRAPLAERVRLQAVAQPDQRPQHRELLPLEAWKATRLEPGRHPQTRRWAQALRQRPELARADASTLAQAVFTHIREAGFSYTLSPGRYDGDAVDGFWMERRLGFCEHYAAAFVVVMRALDIPARIVTGYQGSDPQPVDGYYIVRQSHAHAWAEYWQPGRGWVRADPTAAVSPDRVMVGQALRIPPSGMLGAIHAVNPNVLRSLQLWAEMLDNRWNQWVLGYGRQQQFRLLDKLGVDGTDWGELARVLVIVFSGLGLVGVAWAWWDGRRQTPGERLHTLLRRELAHLGVTVAAHDAPGTLVQRLLSRHGPAAEAVAAQLRTLEQARYGPPPASPWVWRRWRRDFRQQVAALRTTLKSTR